MSEKATIYPKVRPIQNRHIRWITFTLLIAVYATLLLLSLSELNPDWLAYKIIYESGGAWLSEQGRDPLFLAINSLSLLVLGPTGYEIYRALIAIYFGAIITLAASGKLIENRSIRWPSTAFLVALIYIGLTRFTIQIREGIACTLIIIAMGLFSKPSDKTYALTNKKNNTNSTRRAVAWIALIAATQIHISTLTILALALIAWFGLPDKPSDRTIENRIKATWIGGTLLAVAVMAQLKLGGNLEVLASNTVGDRLFEARNTSIQQIVLWIIYGLISIMLYREAGIAKREHLADSATVAFLRLLTGPAATISTASIIAALILEISPLYVSNYVRLLYLFLALALVRISAITNRPKRIIAAGVFLILDQIRTVTESIYIYFGIDLF